MSLKGTLVWCLAIDWCFAARNFRFPRGASDEHTLQRSVRSEQRSGKRKGLRPGGLRRKRPGASLLLGHRALRLCSLVAPCPRPFWAQRNTSQLRDATLGLPLVVSSSPHSSRLRYLQVAPLGRITNVQPRWLRIPCPLHSAMRPSPTPAIGNPPSRPHSCLVAIGGRFTMTRSSLGSNCSPARTTSRLP